MIRKKLVTLKHYNWYQSLDSKLDTSMTGSKIDLEKFTRKNDFNMWKVKMEALLITQGLGDTLEPIIKKE